MRTELFENELRNKNKRCFCLSRSKLWSYTWLPFFFDTLRWIHHEILLDLLSKYSPSVTSFYHLMLLPFWPSAPSSHLSLCNSIPTRPLPSFSLCCLFPAEQIPLETWVRLYHFSVQNLFCFTIPLKKQKLIFLLWAKIPSLISLPLTPATASLILSTLFSYLFTLHTELLVAARKL